MSHRDERERHARSRSASRTESSRADGSGRRDGTRSTRHTSPTSGGGGSSSSIPLPAAVGIRIPLDDPPPHSAKTPPSSRTLHPAASLDSFGPAFSLGGSTSHALAKSQSTSTLGSRGSPTSRPHRDPTRTDAGRDATRELARESGRETGRELSREATRRNSSRRSTSRDAVSRDTSRDNSTRTSRTSRSGPQSGRASSSSRPNFDEMLRSLDDVGQKYDDAANLSRRTTAATPASIRVLAANDNSAPRSAGFAAGALSLDNLVATSRPSTATSSASSQPVSGRINNSLAAARDRLLRSANSLETIDASPQNSPLERNGPVISSVSGTTAGLSATTSPTSPSAGRIGEKLGNWFNFGRKGSNPDTLASADSPDSGGASGIKRESFETRIARLDPNDPLYSKKVAREKERERRYRIAELEQELAVDDARDRAERDVKMLEEREQENERKKMERLEREQEEANERRRDREFFESDRDLAKLRREQRKIHEDRANADRHELELVAAARQKEGEIITRKAVALIPHGQIDESRIDPGYIRAVINFLKKDNSMPAPEDFISSDGFEFYMDTVGMPFGEILGDYLQARFLKRSSSLKKDPDAFDPIDIKFSVVEARGLIAKEGRSRDAYCSVELGAIPPDNTEAYNKWDKRRDRTVFNTESKPGTLNPRWNQHIPIQANTLMDSIMITVLDSGKDQFLGRVRLSYAEIITAAAREGRFKRWIPLGPAPNKSKDKNKYAGGELLVIGEIKDTYGGLGTSRDQRRPGEGHDDAVAKLHKELVQTSLDFRALYKTLLLGCLNLDLKVSQGKIDDSTFDLLSIESKSILKILGRSWRVSDAYMVIAYLELIFSKYCEAGKAPLIAVLSAYERLKEDIRNNPVSFEGHERQSAEEVLNKMYTHCKDQLSKYKEFFPKNLPKGALETTILVMRMIYKNKLFIESHTDLPASFRDELKSILTEAAIARYNKLQELTAPFDKQDVEAVIHSVIGMAEQVCNEIEDDAKYFQIPFQRELDIVRLTAETYLKYFVLTLENNTDLMSQEEAVQSAGKAIFELYKRVRIIDERYAKMVPGLKRISMNAGFSVERWFAPFVVQWLEHLSKRTLEWVRNAVYSDSWQPLDESTTSERHHSSSVKDVFSAIYQELDFLMDLHWSYPVQNAGFCQLYAKSVNAAMDQYCAAITETEIPSHKPETGTTIGGINWSNYLPGRKGVAPVDISSVSCIKLCNIEYAMAKLDGLYRHMDAPTMSRILRDYKKNHSQNKPETAQELEESETITGSFRLQIAYGEDIKGVNKNGVSNPYLVVRLPEGTKVYPEASLASTKKKNSGKLLVDQKMQEEEEKEGEVEVEPIILTGAACEIARSRVIYDTINPTWDETFAIMLPPVKSFEMIAYSKNLITSDDILGNSVLNLSRGSRLRRRLINFQTHDVFVELEPQGRVMLRMTMEGSDDDIDFWFRKAKERLGRTRNDIVRHLVNKIMPYILSTITKMIKEQEAIAVQSKNFFTSLTTAQEYTSNTISGAYVNDPMPLGEADALIDPVIEYLNRNLAMLTDYLSIRLAQEVIRRCWEEILNVAEYAMVPQMFGAIEKERRLLNVRQTSLIKFVIQELKVFFNAEGAEMGLPLKILESRKYNDCIILIEKYHQDISRNKREYELELLKGKDRESLIRLIRLKVERSNTSGYTEDKRAADRDWIETQISKRKELARR